MTALAGLWNWDAAPEPFAACARMLKAQAIYGPHASDRWDGGELAIGRALFRTLAEDRYDRQPMLGGGDRFAMVADVRIDNRAELAAMLGLDDARLRTMADSALLLAAWERFEENCFAHIAGDYAFALWDRPARRLVLARDPLGMRPLHYHRGRGFLAFASMAKGLHAIEQIPIAPDEERVAEELALLPHAGPQSFFAGIERVEPGCYAILTPDGTRVRRHWEPRRGTIRLATPDAYAEAMREQLDRAVKARLRGAEGAVGAQLSAGMDSAAVATSAALQMARDKGRVIAFTAVPRRGYDGPAPRNRVGDEGPGAAQTAALHTNIEHVLVPNDRHSPLDHLDRHFFLFERPVLNLCNRVWQDAINQAARDRGLTVLLTGQFGNMTISYDGLPLLPALLRRGRWLAWLREGRALLRASDMRPGGLLAASLGPYLPSPLWRWINQTLRHEQVGMAAWSALRDGRIDRAELAGRAHDRAFDPDFRPRRDGFEARLWAMRRVDIGNSNKGTLAGWGIDTRDPTGDRRLIEFCLSVPDEQYLRNGETRAVARRALAGRIPATVLAESRKGLQAIDWHEGLTAARGAIDAELARLREVGPAADALDLERMAALSANWPEDGWEKPQVMQSYRLALLRGISSGHFLRRASGTNR